LAIKELQYVEESPDEWRMIQEEIIKVITEDIYLPLITLFGYKPTTQQNSLEDLEKAIQR
jgi:pantothenate kinase